MASDLAPCVAVVGPANSGKTSFLHLLDEALQHHPSAPLVYVVKGNPDGTGRYLFHAPELREPLKARVKGAWCEVTVETICQWIENCRRRLDLVLLDVGGKHSPTNERLFRAASHFVVVARQDDDAAREVAEGMDSWWRACKESGLAPVGRVRSLWKTGEAEVETGSDGTINATFRADACAPGDQVNRAVVEQIMEGALALCRERTTPPYLDLRLQHDWTPEDLFELGGLATRLEAQVAAGSTLVLGGRAPVWAYAAALHRALAVRPAAAIEVFDPKVPSGFVKIPQQLGREADSPLGESVAARWREASGGGAVLDLTLTTPDGFLPPGAEQSVASAPLPAGEPPSGPVVVYGSVPIWLHVAYSRWLRSLPGVRVLGSWDARTGKAVLVAGPGAPRAVDWSFENGASSLSMCKEGA